MERIELDDVTLAYVDEGTGPETVVFSHSYLVDHRQFRAQIDALAGTHRVIAFDHRDHGESDRATAAYTLKDLVGDAESLLDSLAATPCHFVGLSTGGFVGMRLALQAPERFTSLTLMDTSADRERPLDLVRNRALLTTLRLFGTRPVMSSAMALMFGPTFRKDPDRQDEVATWRDRIRANDPKALIRFANAIIARDDKLEELRSLQVPTHVIVGRDDQALGVDKAEAIAQAVPGAQLSVIPQAGHLCTIDQPDAVNEVLVPFIRAHSGSR